MMASLKESRLLPLDAPEEFNEKHYLDYVDGKPRYEGMKLGRPKGPGKSKLDKYHEEIVALLKNGSTKSFVAKKYETTLPNLYNWLKKNEINNTLNH